MEWEAMEEGVELHGRRPVHAVLLGSGAKLIKGNLNTWLHDNAESLFVHDVPLAVRWESTGTIRLSTDEDAMDWGGGGGVQPFAVCITERKEEHAWFAYRSVALVEHTPLRTDNYPITGPWKMCRHERKWSKEFAKRSYLSVQGNVRLSVYTSHASGGPVVVNVAFKQQKSRSPAPERGRREVVSPLELPASPAREAASPGGLSSSRDMSSSPSPTRSPARAKKKGLFAARKHMSMPLSGSRGNRWVAAGAPSGSRPRRLTLSRTEEAGGGGGFEEAGERVGTGPGAAAAAAAHHTRTYSQPPVPNSWVKAGVTAEETRDRRGSFLPERTRAASFGMFGALERSGEHGDALEAGEEAPTGARGFLRSFTRSRHSLSSPLAFSLSSSRLAPTAAAAAAGTGDERRATSGLAHASVSASALDQAREEPAPRAHSATHSAGMLPVYDGAGELFAWEHASPTPQSLFGGITISERRISPPRARAQTDAPTFGSRFVNEERSAGRMEQPSWWDDVLEERARASTASGRSVDTRSLNLEILRADAMEDAERLYGRGSGSLSGSSSGAFASFGPVSRPDFSTVTVNDDSGETTHQTASDVFDDTFSDCTCTLTANDHTLMDSAYLLEDAGVDDAVDFDF